MTIKGNQNDEDNIYVPFETTALPIHDIAKYIKKIHSATFPIICVSFSCRHRRIERQ